MREIRISGIRRLLRISLTSNDVRHEVAEEIQFHLDARVAELRQQGLSEREAHDSARAEFGDVEESKRELARVDRRRVGLAHRKAHFMSMRDDLRYAVRSLARRPSLLAVITLTLSLGIAANAIMFGVVDQLLLRAPAHVVSPERVKRLNFRSVGHQGIGKDSPLETFVSSVTTYPVLTALRANTTGFSELAAYSSPSEYSLGRGRDARPALTQLVSGNYFHLLGVRAALGRVFTVNDDQIPIGEPVAILSYRFWQLQFAGDSTAIGRELLLQGKTFTIIGVAPRGFSGIDRRNVDVWLPISAIARESLGQGWYNTTNNWWAEIIGRVGSEVAPQLANEQATRAYGDIVRTWNDAQRDSSSIVFSSIIGTRSPNGLSQESKVSLWLMGVSVMVMLVACANVANLLLVRTIERRREIAVRIALGVSRARLLRMLLTETALLALVASLAAMIIAFFAGALVRNVLLPNVVWSESVLDVRVFLFTLSMAVACMFLAGLAPALQGLRTKVSDGLKASSRTISSSGGRVRFALLLTQTAMSVILLIGAGLFIQSLHNVVSREVGVDRDQVVRVSMPLSRFGFDPAQVEDIYRRGVEQLQGLAGVTSVSVARMTYPMGGATAMGFSVPGVKSPTIAGGGPYNAAVTSGFFATVGARILKGRDFTRAEELHGARVLIVNEKLAKAYWPDGNALGRCAKFGGDSVCSEVIGVVGNLLQFNVINDDRAIVYATPRHPGAAGSAPGAMLVRISGDVSVLVPAIRRELQSLAPTMPFVQVKAISELLAPQLQPWRLSATMFTLFGVIALVMAAVGLYSLMAYWVSQRTHEIGVRMALGAQRSDVVRLVARQSSLAVAAGLLVGGGVAFIASRFAVDMLYETSPHDPRIYLGAALVLAAAATVASIVPARRSTVINPSQAIRAD
ncbi:MAG: ADOP family duplicated permease [Gemmatimonas sp.]